MTTPVVPPGQAPASPAAVSPAASAAPAVTPHIAAAISAASVPASPPPVGGDPSTLPPVIPPAPISYVLKVPDGGALDPGASERTVAFAAKLGLSQDAAQAALDHASAESRAYWKMQEARADIVRRQEWVSQTQGDPEIGGAKFVETVKAAALARQTYFTPEFDKLLNDTGLGNHPEFVRAWARVGRSLSEGALINPPAAAPAEKKRTAAQTLYPNMRSEADPVRTG